jgi:hypothetical protein
VYLRNHDAAELAHARRLSLTAGTHLQTAVRRELGELLEDATADRAALAGAMRALGVRPSRVQRTVSTVGERIGRLKPNASWSRRTPLTDVVELEALGLAATGTLRLWQTLVALTPLHGRLGDLDLPSLVAGARRRVETLERLHADSVRALVHDGG